MRFGTQILLNGVNLPASAASIGNDDPDYMPAGTGNADFIDTHAFTVTPSGTKPHAGQTLTWEGNTYVILGIRTIDSESTTASWRIIAYLQAASANAPSDANQIAAWHLAT